MSKKTQKKIRCPVCGWETSQYIILKRKETNHHITRKAQQELWAREFDKNIKTPHLNYFRKKVKSGSVEIKYTINY